MGIKDLTQSVSKPEICDNNHVRRKRSSNSHTSQARMQSLTFAI